MGEGGNLGKRAFNGDFETRDIISPFYSKDGGGGGVGHTNFMKKGLTKKGAFLLRSKRG